MDAAIVVAVVVEDLHLRTGEIGLFVFSGIFLDIEEDAAVATGGDLPFQLEIEIFIFFVGEKIAVAFAAVGIGCEGAIPDGPAWTCRGLGIRMPAVGGET